MSFMALASASLAVTLTSGFAVNVDFGPPGSSPSPQYAAQGEAGTWNAIGVLPPYQRAPLVGLDGLPSSVQIYMAGAASVLEQDDAATSGDDAALLDDMLRSTNSPIDLCIWFENVPAGDYEVILYALTPSDGAHQDRCRVDYGSPGPSYVGGAWQGFHTQGVSYMSFRVNVQSGWIGLHSGEYGAQILSGLNGVQVRPAPPTGSEPPDTESGWESRLLRIHPNPSAGAQSIELTLGRGAQELEIVDVAGRIVWSRTLAGFQPGARRIAWDGRDAHGRPLASSVYFVRLRAERALPDAACALRIVRTPLR